MMSAEQLYRAGKLDEAVRALSDELRDRPADARRRTFLFELLCFKGDFDRASKHLDVLAQSGKGADLGALLYRSAIHAERIRRGLFEKNEFPDTTARSSLKGSVNGRPFESITDGDPRIGARLEVFAAGEYLWIPIEQIASIEISPPRRVRDLIWAPGVIKTGPGFNNRELGETLFPVLTPFAWQDSDDEIRLGRATAWYRTPDGVIVPGGQKVLIVDGEEMPFLELRRLEIEAAQTATS